MSYTNKLRSLWNSNSLFKGSLIYILGSVFLKGVSFILIPLYTSIFTPADYGVMELINTIMALLIILISFGFSQLIYIEYTHLLSNERVNYIRKINFSFNALAIPLLIVIGIVLYFVQERIFSTNYSLVLFIMILTVYLSFFQNNMYAILQLEQKPKLVTYNKAIVAVALLCLNVVLVKFLKIGILGVYIANLVGILISLILLKITSKESGDYLGVSPIERRDILNYVKHGFPFIVTSLAYFCINGVDRFIIQSLLGEDELGLYSLGFKFGSMLEPLLIAPILSAYNPFIFKKFSEGNFNQNIVRNCISILAGFLTIAILLPFFAKFIIASKFYYSLKLIPIFVMGFAFLFLAQMFAAPLLYFKKKKALVYNVILASVINIILNFLLIKFYGVQGSAFAFLFTNLFWFFLTVYQSKKVNNDLK